MLPFFGPIPPPLVGRYSPSWANLDSPEYSTLVGEPTPWRLLVVILAVVAATSEGIGELHRVFLRLGWRLASRPSPPWRLSPCAPSPLPCAPSRPPCGLWSPSSPPPFSPLRFELAELSRLLHIITIIMHLTTSVRKSELVVRGVEYRPPQSRGEGLFGEPGDYGGVG